jgi:hypothetical protein
MSQFKSRWLLAIAAMILSLNLMADEVYDSPDALSLPGLPADPQWRVRGGVGLAEINADGYDGAPAFEVAGQKTIDDQVAIELGFIHFSDFDNTTLNRSIGGDVLKLSVVGYSPYTKQHRYFFRLGGFRSDLDSTSTSTTANDTDTGFFGGFGISCRVASQLSVTTELNQLFSASEIDFTQVLLGLEYEIL